MSIVSKASNRLMMSVIVQAEDGAVPGPDRHPASDESSFITGIELLFVDGGVAQV